jgi:carbon-monoxide dehydrogenase large subunit
VLHSDTADQPARLDTYGSRSLAVGAWPSTWPATGHRQGPQIAAHQLEAPRRTSSSRRHFTCRARPDRRLPLAAIAFERFTAHNLPDGMEPNLEATVTYDPPNFSWPFGTHICVVEVDTETGASTC